MTGLRTAAQQALEALEKLVVGSEYEEAVEAEQAIDALKAALAEPVLNPAKKQLENIMGNSQDSNEPVAWIHTDPDKRRVKFLEWRENEPGYRGDWIKTPLYAAPPQPEERNFCSRCGKRTQDIHTCTPP